MVTLAYEGRTIDFDSAEAADCWVNQQFGTLVLAMAAGVRVLKLTKAI